ncbi:MAG: Glutamate-tRNA ligase [Candidatus Nomurabacteria bacterium GW2011_GWF2_35_66]|uniref:Glutamate--tRNA ligase n=1 Tax=Candidatus Nomurabacteria bacterium GW2011_GWE1_35_16 TaxID=1618761 RepID=A0A0G0BAV9_9BACT|nr:MAG: Glutamate-tRNA ligase [Candidatus Nomurabacteria bacterium GW2011_GWF1_34_20]KKP63381.1 MAG: Glutamate-tRNA ligase [Candidatus Nomurabacteria bacterium GW2011_GWE2_34_25]KKP66573.1 MAG: Glutamate-tRNA ligase [Candidatus Nomurabacteria bacterium GW2011_GWE1_35_16]KKP83619.1 MAG: Glutamate-tRNA ligase [Candidatus Nomurabacteria bacterium GW2011_GWF2_35_66]HAE36879.1 glutamate--tRNA ligase [Candidatus Nomurabacteria bacterium]
MENQTQKVVTRFAPSPTGFVHIGNIRTALYAWAFARKNNGTFILRVEDTDKAREVDGSIEHVIASLKWLGIDWDEGPDIGGSNAPYKQSERLESYIKYAKILIEKGLAYSDPYTEEEVEAFRKKADEEKRPFLYRDHRPENTPVWDGTKPLRFKVTDIKSYEWIDVVRGHLKAGPEALDDFILIKSDGYPTYNFAHIIDDLEMGVTHVMRGDEFISSTPKFLSIFDALEIQRPEFVTLPPIMGVDGKKKLGKRDGAKDFLEYKEEGYLPSAMMNFLAFIGWSPEGEQEILTPEEFINLFDIKKIHISGGKYNEEKLDWINKEHIKKLSPEELEKNIFYWLPTELQIRKIVPLIMERISKFGDIKNMVDSGELDFFYKEPEYETSKLIYKDVPLSKIKSNLEEALGTLQNTEEADFTFEKIKALLMEIANHMDSRGEVLHPLRFALSGLDKSPDPFILADILGKKETISRINKAISLLNS